jgi:hypothetical protein
MFKNKWTLRREELEKDEVPSTVTKWMYDPDWPVRGMPVSLPRLTFLEKSDDLEDNSE